MPLENPPGPQSMESKDIERRFRSGEVIVERGSAARELFIVREGAVLLQECEGGVAQLLAPGDAFGEAAVILGRPHSVRAEAEGDAIVLALDVPLLNRLCAQSPELAARLLRQLAERADPGRSAREITGSVPLVAEERPAAPQVPSRAAPPARPRSAESERGLAAALLRSAQGDEPPLAVQGRLADLAHEAGLEILDAYTCLQRLLDRHLLRLVDDQLSILKVDELRELAS
jgi:CRP-like cAMP-binding protein